MDLDQLQSVRDRERQTDRLQQLRESFYEEAADFVADLRAERDAAAEEAADPFDSPRVNRLTDRIRTAEQTLEAIYEKRVGKVVKAATFAAADLPAEADGMTKEEADLFDTLVDEIEANRARVLDRLRGDHADDVPAAPANSDAGSADGDEGVPAADLMGEDAGDSDAGPPDGGAGDDERPPPPPPPDADDADEGDSELGGASDLPADTSDGEPPADASDDAPPDEASSGAGASDVDRQLVRITDDVGPILGVDEREYDLAADDVVTLPAANAEPLVDRGAAERLE